MIGPSSWVFYVTLAGASLVIGGLAVAMCRSARSIAPAVGVLFLYFWSLYGAWFLIIDLSGGDSGMRYHYLFGKLFPISLDWNYYYTILIYSIFILTIQGSFLVSLRPLGANNINCQAPLNRIRIDHRVVLVVAAMAGIGSIALMYEKISAAADLGIAAYAYARNEGNAGSLFNLHQVLNRVSLLPAALGCAVWLGGSATRWITGSSSKAFLAAYGIILGCMFVFCLLLGNKNELMLALVGGVLLYLSNTLHPRWGRLVISAAIGVSAIFAIDYTRGLAINEIATSQSASVAVESVSAIATSNEAYGAHFSMYGAVAFDVPLTWGSSLVSLLASVIPRLAWPDRPEDIYVHYAASIHATEGQGYSIHHAAGWYLNFGIVGVLLGAVVLGMVWAWFVNGSLRRINSDRSNGIRLLFILAPSTFVAYFPSLIRGGPEGYKGVCLEALLIPVTVLWVATRTHEINRKVRDLYLPKRGASASAAGLT